MASLTPGILLKLLQHLDDEHVKVAGEHRSALLQVISIVPSLGDDPWKSRGFYLRVSDSVHSAYVSVSDEDVELILSDKIQLGQFIHVARLGRGSPVPVLCGVRPVPKRRPCVGDPKDLISSDVLTPRKGGDMRKGKKDGIMARKLNEIKGKVKSEEMSTRRLSMSNGNVEGLEARRLSLDSVRKGWDRSPGTKTGVKEVSKSKLKETLTSGSVRSPSSRSHSGSFRSPGSQSVSVRSPGSRSVSAQSPGSHSGPVPNPGSHSIVSSEKPSPRTGTKPKSSSSIASPLQNKNVVVSPKTVSKPIRKDLSVSSDEALPCHFNKVTLSFKNWSDSKISWTSLPSSISDLGKEVTEFRNIAFMSAVHALEEASAAEGVIRCLSMFAELCETSQKEYAAQVVESFLNLHESMHNASAIAKALLNKNTEAQNKLCCNLADDKASAWVQAAVEKDLSKFSLFTKEEKISSNGKKCYLVMMEDTPKKIGPEKNSPQNKQSPTSRRRSVSDSSVKKVHPNSGRRLSASREEWSEGNGLKDVANLAENLLASSRAWFLNYLEYSLKNRFGLKSGEANSQTASLLGQLKRVNQWLDEAVHEASGAKERIESLRKKLYEFLLDHVDSAILHVGS